MQFHLLPAVMPQALQRPVVLLPSLAPSCMHMWVHAQLLQYVPCIGEHWPMLTWQ
jgi:hypothetical protein